MSPVDPLSDVAHATLATTMVDASAPQIPL